MGVAVTARQLIVTSFADGCVRLPPTAYSAFANTRSGGRCECVSADTNTPNRVLLQIRS